MAEYRHYQHQSNHDKYSAPDSSHLVPVQGLVPSYDIVNNLLNRLLFLAKQSYQSRF